MAALSVPMPSGVLALMPTREGSMPSSSATFCWIAAACGPISRRGQDQSAVHVAHRVSSLVDQLQRLAHEDRGVGALPLGIAWRKVGPDIAGGDGAQQRIGEGVQQDVAIGVAGESAVMMEA